jgi:hypothetical protein
MDSQISRLGLVAIAISAVAAVATTTAAATVATTTASTTATAEAAATAAASAVAATTTTTAATTTALFARAGFVDGQGAAIVLLTVEGGNRGSRFLVRGHFDESEAFASAGVPIVDDLSRDDLSMCCEQLFEFRAIDGVAQVPDIQLLTHRNLL